MVGRNEGITERDVQTLSARRRHGVCRVTENLEAPNEPEGRREEVEELHFGLALSDPMHLAARRLGAGLVEDLLQVRRRTLQPGADEDQLQVELVLLGVNETCRCGRSEQQGEESGPEAHDRLVAPDCSTGVPKNVDFLRPKRADTLGNGPLVAPRPWVWADLREGRGARGAQPRLIFTNSRRRSSFTFTNSVFPFSSAICFSSEGRISCAFFAAALLSCTSQSVA